MIKQITSKKKPIQFQILTNAKNSAPTKINFTPPKRIVLKRKQIKPKIITMTNNPPLNTTKRDNLQKPSKPKPSSLQPLVLFSFLSPNPMFLSLLSTTTHS
jgi:hypothetical protein